uniref:Photosystem II reaction center protein Psb30 n=1 Tax=Mesostigma viride TaxID=41882 RepID=PSB30_MESVI|nr:hypothetical chloroplast RF12 [Mesostigma viride]Q9MUS3.1 RecName: Full=Photosystem II reaction center protein Psb30; AltName: Full=Photosystem II reaction center protein Ycf12 [Mesostigma viride]AAF43828.1 hypothetical chloroplast RF12 [Mesostigma viride]WKT08294.1 hypothetical chloroplast RF12 [Mesostigma viride]WKT08400.1 hypothetical chloroplast RF12 [Mesostigma viride]
MNLEVVVQLGSLSLIVLAGPIIVLLLASQKGNL